MFNNIESDASFLLFHIIARVYREVFYFSILGYHNIFFHLQTRTHKYFVFDLASDPVFIAETSTCLYQFEWESPHICQPVGPGNSNGSAALTLTNGEIAGIIIAVLAVVLLISGIIIYKRKQRRSWEGEFSYNRLSTDDDTTLLVSSSKNNGPRFYDDDDDNLII